MATIEKISGYDKDQRRQAVIDLLAGALGDHQLVSELQGCFDSQGKDQKTKDEYCNHHLFCDICSMPRWRLLKGVFYLAYHSKMKDFYSVTITPQGPVAHLNRCSVEFADMEKELQRKWCSYIGCREIKSVEPSTAGHSLWPHIHVIAVGKKPDRPKRSNPFSKQTPVKPRFRMNEPHKINLQEVEKYLWHHSKCLPLSWFPEKQPSETHHLVNLNNIDLNQRQQEDVSKMIQNEPLLLEDLKIGMGVFHGEFDLKIYDSPLLNLLRNEKIGRNFADYASTFKEQSDFKKVMCYLYLVLKGDSQSDARKSLGYAGDNGRKRFEALLHKHTEKAFKVLAWSKMYEWKPPSTLSDEYREVLEIALSEIHQNLIRAKHREKRKARSLKVFGDDKLRRILVELGLETKEKRLFAKHTESRNQSDGGFPLDGSQEPQP